MYAPVFIKLSEHRAQLAQHLEQCLISIELGLVMPGCAEVG